MTAVVLLLSVALAIPAVDYDESVERGRSALRDRDYAAAAAAFEEAIELRPDGIEAWFRLGLARSANDEADAAIAAYRRAADLDANHAQARNNLGNVLFRRGDYEEALVWYDRALAIRPDYIVALYHRGWVLRHFNRNEDAEEAFNRCLGSTAGGGRERSTQLDCLFFAGTLRFRAEDYTGAAAAMTRLLESNPGHIEAHYYLGMAYRHLGRIEEARKQLEIHRRMTRAVRRDEPIEKVDR